MYYNQNNNFTGFQNPQQIATADSIIMELNNAITATLNRQVTNVMHVRDVVNKMISENKIRKVGGGQNRVAIQIVPDHTRLKQMLNMPGNIVIMVPVKLPEGIRDNLRADAMFKIVSQQGLNPDPDMKVICSTALPSKIIPNTNLLAQEMVTRIEDSTFVKNRIASGKYDPVKQLGLVCRDVLLTDPYVSKAYRELIQAWDKFFVIADLNAEFSPWNFGFRHTQAGQQLVILDYGYVVYKTKPLVCPSCGRPLKYVIPGEELLENDAFRALRTNASTFGYYSCKNLSCKRGQNTAYQERDTDVFLRYTEGV